MCGLAGVAGKIDFEDVKVFSDLLRVSAIRGIDSTGIAVIPYQNKPDDIEVVKSLGNAYDLLDRISVRNALKPGSAIFMGHTRWRTKGDINKINAQPFEFPNLIGTHNGTLGDMTKARLEGPKEWFGTDSEALYSSINKGGLEPTLEKLERMDAAALVWYDRDTNKLHMYRNDMRPLHFCFNKKHSTLYWASEAGMLHLVLNHNKIDFKKTHRLEAGQLLTMDMPDKEEAVMGKPFIRPIRTQWFQYPVNKRAEESARLFMMGGQRDLPFAPQVIGGTSTTVTSIGSPVISNYSSGSLVRLDDIRAANIKWKPDTLQNRAEDAGGPFYKTACGKFLDEAAFDEKANEGCALNGEVPVFGEPVKFLKDDSFVCASCLAMAKSGTLDTLSKEALEAML